ncbi:FAD/NAD(P)-binding domain-containing protein [Heliocybe sulcata]|uniref:FAD/NAD(P)-binding domain-containing protein n=1 Tax=Heliocybe sulcata TaxID=5364 RepID=A0A5C3MWH9_9AGAM|nr:FAD/NAD(P)-binding domain-containing protein [Heliocybe sulcata]
MRAVCLILQWALLRSFLGPYCAPDAEPARPSKRVCVVGAGTAGLAALKALLDLPEDVRDGWQIDVFEQRHDVGGLWLPQPDPPSPPGLPDTPMYPSLRTNLAHPTMTFPQFVYPPMTPLYPSHSAVQAYHDHFARHYDLRRYISFSHTVLNATYEAESAWRLDIQTSHAVPVTLHYDHLIVASGHNHCPHIPALNGKNSWLSGGPGEREILHSIWFREPSAYRNQTVIVAGNGDSGRDIAMQVSKVAKNVYHSYDHNTLDPVFSPPVPQAIYKPRISHLTSSSIVFTDNSTLETSGPTTILLATGYEYIVPFLPTLSMSSSINYSTTSLSTNTRYIRPLYRHVLALDPVLPTNALAFIGLPMWVATAPSDYTQGLFAAHAIANGSMLLSRETMLSELEARERALEDTGMDPFFIGHRLTGKMRLSTTKMDS